MAHSFRYHFPVGLKPLKSLVVQRHSPCRLEIGHGFPRSERQTHRLTQPSVERPTADYMLLADPSLRNCQLVLGGNVPIGVPTLWMLAAKHETLVIPAGKEG
jgi:hypothetical protein